MFVLLRVLRMLNSLKIRRQRNKYDVKRLPGEEENYLGMSVFVIILLQSIVIQERQFMSSVMVLICYC